MRLLCMWWRRRRYILQLEAVARAAELYIVLPTVKLRGELVEALRILSEGDQ